VKLVDTLLRLIDRSFTSCKFILLTLFYKRLHLFMMMKHKLERGVDQF
jgi:hypothetical protein